jgi:hypothetical protein
MPALPNVPNVIRVACKGSSGGAETWLTRFYLQYPTVAPSAANLVSLGNEIITSWNTHLNPLTPGNKTLTEVDLQDLTNPSAAVATIATSQNGTRVGAWLPPVAATVVSYSIGRRYRGGHPRGYWPFGVEGDLDTSGQWLPLWVTTVDVGIRAFFSDVTSFIWAVSEITKHCNVSYYSGFTVVTDPITGRARNVPKLRAGGPVVDLVSIQSARIIVGTQRRRGQF